MKVRFYRKPEDAERNAGRVMCEKTIQDHTSAGVKPSIASDVATDADKLGYQAEYTEFLASESPAGAVEDVSSLAAGSPDPAPAVAKAKKKR